MDVHEHSQAITPGEKTGRKWRSLICYLRFMFSREIQLDTHGGPVTLAPRWLRVPGAVKYSGLSGSKLYEFLSDGRIRSIYVRSHKGHNEEFVSLTESRSTRSWRATRPCEMVLVSTFPSRANTGWFSSRIKRLPSEGLCVRITRVQIDQ
jgi:hypothetical protein